MATIESNNAPPELEQNLLCLWRSVPGVGDENEMEKPTEVERFEAYNKFISSSEDKHTADMFFGRIVRHGYPWSKRPSSYGGKCWSIALARAAFTVKFGVGANFKDKDDLCVKVRDKVHQEIFKDAKEWKRQMNNVIWFNFPLSAIALETIDIMKDPKVKRAYLLVFIWQCVVRICDTRFKPEQSKLVAAYEQFQKLCEGNTTIPTDFTGVKKQIREKWEKSHPHTEYPAEYDWPFHERHPLSKECGSLWAIELCFAALEVCKDLNDEMRKTFDANHEEYERLVKDYIFEEVFGGYEDVWERRMDDYGMKFFRSRWSDVFYSAVSIHHVSMY